MGYNKGNKTMTTVDAAITYFLIKVVLISVFIYLYKYKTRNADLLIKFAIFFFIASEFVNLVVNLSHFIYN